MARQNVPFIALGNRGLISPKALARTDIDRLRMAAEVFTNWIGKTVGALTIRPGTKWMGSSLNDTGAEFLEFVAKIDDVALVEVTHQKARVWLGSDAHNLSLLGRPKVDTVLTLSDTGWANTSTGGAGSTPAADAIPTMTAATTSGVTVSASSEHSSGPAWFAADDVVGIGWTDTGEDQPSTLPTWWKVDFGAGNTKAIKSYSLRAANEAPYNDHMPSNWTLIASDYDTGTYATDTGKWKLEDTQGSETSWAVAEKRTYGTTEGDTGTVAAKRFWRFNFLAGNTAFRLIVSEIEMFTAASAQQVKLQAGKRVLNATAVGSLARAEKRVMVSDTGTEHSLAIDVERGPITLRVGSAQRDDDYVRETVLGTGRHNLAFTPEGNFWVTLQSDTLVDRIVRTLTIGDSGTVEITAPWAANDLANIRYDQSADVIYVDCDDVRPQKIERRGTGRSWSVVDYAPDNGPFLPFTSTDAKITPNARFGNTTLSASVPLFTADHVGSLIRVFHEGQTGQWQLGALNAVTDAIEVTGYSDTGTGAGGERLVDVTVAGTYVGTVVLERSFNGSDQGFHDAQTNYLGGQSASDTGTFARTINDLDDNVSVWYRARLSSYTSGVAEITLGYAGGGVTGISRITGYNHNSSVNVEVLSRFSGTVQSDNWQLGYWSTERGFPTAVALHGGRLAHAQGGTLFLSVSDDYENFDDGTVGDAGPIVRTLGSGPVATIRWLISKLRLLIGTDGSELSLTSSSLDEPVTPTNSAARGFSSRGSANVRAITIDSTAIHVQRSGQRLMVIGPSQNAIGDYASSDLTQLVPELMRVGVTSIAIQRQPDTRIHCVLADGKVAILTYEPNEEVVAWSMWQGDTGTAPAVERVAVLPGTNEDAVFYHVRRTINGATKRYLEKWAKETECTGDSGLCWLMDCARSYTDTGRNTALVDIATHLVGEAVVVWSDDTGTNPGVDRSPDVSGVQTMYTVDTGGDVTLSVAVHHGVAGLPYKADWKSTKLAYAAQAGTALAQMKRTDKIGFSLYKQHPQGLFYGNDTGRGLDPLPRVIEGSTIDQDLILQQTDLMAMPFPGLWDVDSRIHLRAKSPRPATVLAAIPTISTNEKV